jgi:hypothetical protein
MGQISALKERQLYASEDVAELLLVKRLRWEQGGRHARAIKCTIQISIRLVVGAKGLSQGVADHGRRPGSERELGRKERIARSSWG